MTTEKEYPSASGIGYPESLHYTLHRLVGIFLVENDNQLGNLNMEKGKAEHTEGKAKRIRRDFAQIITDKIERKYTGRIEPTRLQQAMDEVEKIIIGLEEQKKDYRALKKFSREELEAYLATLK